MTTAVNVIERIRQQIAAHDDALSEAKSPQGVRIECRKSLSDVSHALRQAGVEAHGAGRGLESIAFSSG